MSKSRERYKNIVMDYILHNIKFEEHIPPQRDISKKVGVNIPDVSMAQAQLEEDGFLIKIDHRTYVKNKSYFSPEQKTKMINIINNAFNMCIAA